MDPAVPQLATGDAQPATPPGAPEPQATALGPPAAAGAEPQSSTAPPQAAGAAQRRKHGDVLGSVQSLAITIVIAVFVITFAVQAFQIPSESMEDTLLIGDYLLVDKVHFAHGGAWGEILPYTAIHRGDIIVFRYPVNPQQHFVKRVIGIPGDHLRLVGKQVYVNGVAVREPYVVYRSNTRDTYRDEFPAGITSPLMTADWLLQMHRLVKGHELVVPPGKFFVLGDNRDESLDSRYWGLVPRENIIGRPLLIYWSMRHAPQMGPMKIDSGDKLFHFAYTLTHFFEETRWDRTFRLIR